MEREFSARGGVPAQLAGTFNDQWSGTDIFDELGDYSWYRDNAGGGLPGGSSHPDYGTHPVGTKSPNELGIYDMTGNVSNLVWDIWGSYPSGSYTNPTGPETGNQRTFRGGCWDDNAFMSTVTTRSFLAAVSASNKYGFRVIRGGAEIESSIFEWCHIPPGDYTYGPPAGGSNYTSIETISYDYEIMKYEVTNAQYLTYLQEAYDAAAISVVGDQVRGFYPGDEHWGAGDYLLYGLSTISSANTARIYFSNGLFFLSYPPAFTEEDYLNHPVVWVTWFGAWHFANYYGLRLPTEHEWEKAARGMTGYEYPWGSMIDGSHANYWGSDDPYEPGTTPIGFYNGETHIVNEVPFITTDSPSFYGVYDLAGNVSNWTDSFYSSESSDRVLRGGSWDNHYTGLHSWSRGFWQPANIYPSIGFRCVRTP